MKLFGNKAKPADEAAQGSVRGARVKVLGSGCKKCMTLAENAKAALTRQGMPAEIEKVTDPAEIAAFGVLSTPALVVDGKVAAYGRVLEPEEISRLL